MSSTERTESDGHVDTGFVIDDHSEPEDSDNDENDDADADTASQRSISLSSPPRSPGHEHNTALHARDFFPRLGSQEDSLEIDFNSETDDVSDSFSERNARRASSITSAAPSAALFDEPKYNGAHTVTYPPTPSSGATDADSFTSAASSYSKKARPESMLLQPPEGPLVLGIALVDFNHLVGPKIEFSHGDIFQDEEIVKILPFLALPDGAHLSLEDYSYFHLVPNAPIPTTIFGISCNRQIPTSALLVKDVDVTRSIVQKAVVVLASKPVFGPIRDRLGVVTRALFEQRDFSDTSILVDFGASLEISLRTQLTESGLYIGGREFVHIFRHRTLVLLKALMCQKKIMFFGHPVERLCTYQYSLISLIPGLLQTLEDSGSPPLAARAPTLSCPQSLRTSDRKSMMAYMGLPLDIFGKDAFFQPYLPLQQLDLLKDSQGWLCGSTNSIVTQQKEIDLLINTETAILEFRNPGLERLMGLTAADRKWMDEIVRDVNDAWDDADPTKPAMHFKGSDDYLRAKFEEYVSAALASVRYREFLAKGKVNNVIITGTGDDNSIDDFNPLWIAEFTKTNAYDVWQRSTDPMLFDIVEPRHPCNEKPSVVADIGIRLSEGLQELKLEQLAPTREAISRTITASSTNFFKAVEGVRGRWQQRTASSTSFNSDLTSGTCETPVEISKSEAELSSSALSEGSKLTSNITRQTSRDSVPGTPTRPVSVAQAASDAKVALGNWGAGIQSFWSGRASRFSISRSSIASVASTDSLSTSGTGQLPTSPMPSSHSHSRPSVGTVEEESEHDFDHTGYESQEPGGIAL
ncbi:transport protein Avl9-domain-containing protein [Suillus paluster]|uniref:transport protein Avl9-domain-containing protein n=1 Tax=Suillus paluster TaxID=48578 RepID=UPI001B8652EF|nr:transport protein Avl9-domain-containing protein [Suillus paluster]KAG1742342.1 transport protein Avl9-domain-containing protein [Suillus paluster]